MWGSDLFAWLLPAFFVIPSLPLKLQGDAFLRRNALTAEDEPFRDISVFKCNSVPHMDGPFGKPGNTGTTDTGLATVWWI